MSDRARLPDRTRPPERVRITHPRTTAVRRLPARTPASEIDELTDLGEVYLASLLRAQRRTALRTAAATVGLLVALAVAAAEVTSWDGVQIAGIRLPWLLVAVAVYPLLIGLGAVGVRLAERNEREFTALMRRR